MELNLDAKRMGIKRNERKIDESSIETFEIGIKVWVLVAHCFRLFVILTALGQTRVSQMRVCVGDSMACSKLFVIEHFDWMNELVHVCLLPQFSGLMVVYTTQSRYVNNIFVSAKPCVEFPLNFLKLFTPLNSATTYQNNIIKIWADSMAEGLYKIRIRTFQLDT